jgi:hypothetical protein
MWSWYNYPPPLSTLIGSLIVWLLLAGVIFLCRLPRRGTQPLGELWGECFQVAGIVYVMLAVLAIPLYVIGGMVSQLLMR